MARLESVRSVISGVARRNSGGGARVVMSMRASVMLREVSRRTGVGVEELGNAAVAALSAALRGGKDELEMRDSRIRDWLLRGEPRRRVK